MRRCRAFGNGSGPDAVLRQPAGTHGAAGNGGMGFAPLASGFMVQRFCDYGGIYYRDFSQQSDALARMGLQ